MPEPIAFLNGSLVPLSEARIGILDLAVLRSFSIYEGITAFGPAPFHFHDHWKRFVGSAEKLGLQLPLSEEEAEKATRELIAHNSPGKRASIRMVLTGGPAIGGLEHRPGTETFFITAEPTTPLPLELYERGASLITHEHLRFMPEAKTTNYITAVTLQEKRKAAGAIEILYHKDGYMLECATSNACIVKDRTVITPGTVMLLGITRKVALELARSAGYTVEERPVTMEEVWDADEVFITSSFKDIVPIVAIDGRAIGAGVPGPVTQDLMERFARYTQTH